MLACLLAWARGNVQIEEHLDGLALCSKCQVVRFMKTKFPQIDPDKIFLLKSDFIANWFPQIRMRISCLSKALLLLKIEPCVKTWESVCSQSAIDLDWPTSYGHYIFPFRLRKLFHVGLGPHLMDGLNFDPLLAFASWSSFSEAATKFQFSFLLICIQFVRRIFFFLK